MEIIFIPSTTVITIINIALWGGIAYLIIKAVKKHNKKIRSS
ncbi:hypothetical protein [Clostridium oryzae]|uniref:Uncharacterized protein n=1 Tax=Clostridium oryzae TaxID=1450648 RepID=A0A1V4ILR5_9CLOT|nr:hypothetical protein [Clostridium oryzae]OPJ60760.1 hypothetical protein CLORY_26280 [Clostridium oryzae]